MYETVEHGFFSSKIFCMVIFREGHGDILFLARSRPYKLFLKSRNEHAWTQFKFLTFCCASFKLIVADKSRIIKENCIPFFCRSFYEDHAGVSLLERFYFLIYIFIFDFLYHLVYLYALVILNIYYRIAGYGYRCGEAFSFCYLAKLSARAVDNFKLQFSKCLSVILSEKLIYGVFKENSFSVAFFYDASRSFTLSEAIYLKPIFILLISFNLSIFKFFCGKFDREFYIIIFSWDKCSFH